MSIEQKDGFRAEVQPEDKTDTKVGEVQELGFDAEAEKKVLRKFDKFLLPPIFIILLVAYLDRSNLGNAKIFGFEDVKPLCRLPDPSTTANLSQGIGLVGNQFNTISTIFYPAYVVFETPWTMAVKRFGADKVLGIAMIAWSTITLCTGFVQNYSQAIAVRVLLGLFEAGLVPSIVFVFSTIWDREDQSKRVAIIYACNCLSGAFGGLIAVSVTLLDLFLFSADRNNSTALKAWAPDSASKPGAGSSSSKAPRRCSSAVSAGSSCPKTQSRLGS